jgi:hypothetical protein
VGAAADRVVRDDEKLIDRYLPAPIVATALGYHHVTTTRLATEAGTTWSNYAPGDHGK